MTQIISIAQRHKYILDKLKKDGDVTYLSLVVPDEDSVHFYIDALVEEMGDDPANQIAYGSDILYTDAANPDDPADMEKYITIWNQYQQNKGVDHPLVTDNSYGYNYTGISVILDENGKALAEIQYILDMKEVRNYLNSFLINMLLISFCIIAVTMVAYIVFVRKTITRPISRLADFTQEITESGKFENQRITMKTGDEIEALSDSFNFMMEELENYIANLSKVTAEKERIGTELDIARNIQASMLPCIFPAFPDREEFDIFATMTPAKEVGGDFYDFFMVDETHLAIVMADVSGKGVPAALFMVIGKTLIKDHTTPGRDLGEVFSTVNNLLCEANSEGLFITAFEGVLDLVTGEFCFVNAGHEMPFICKSGGSFEAYKIRPGFVLAGFEDMNYKALQKRSKETKINQKTDRAHTKKRFGKSLSRCAPAMFISILSKKANRYGGSVIKVSTFETKASQFDHTDESYTKKKLSERMARLRSGNIVQRDLYSAFLLEHIDTESLQYNMETFNSAFPVFLEMHENTKQRLQAVGSSLPASIGF